MWQHISSYLYNGVLMNARLLLGRDFKNIFGFAYYSRDLHFLAPISLYIEFRDRPFEGLKGKSNLTFKENLFMCAAHLYDIAIREVWKKYGTIHFYLTEVFRVSDCWRFYHLPQSSFYRTHLTFLKV